MNRDKLGWYALAALVGGAFAVWAGLPPVSLLFLLVCPLMMFFMHGGHGGHGGHQGTGNSDERAVRDPAAGHGSDGSHEHIHRP